MRGIIILVCILVLFCAPCFADVNEENMVLSQDWKKEYYIAEFEDLYFDIIINTEPPESAGFLVQSKASQAMHVFMVMDMEIQCGGIDTFFWNCGSAYAAKVPEALLELGLDDVAELYTDFLNENGISMEEIDGYRLEYPDSVGLLGIHPFIEFGNAYIEIWEQTNLNRRVLEYAQEHPEARVGL